MKRFLFKPQFHLVGIFAYALFVEVIITLPVPLWLCFVGGCALAAANDRTKWEQS